MGRVVGGTPIIKDIAEVLEKENIELKEKVRALTEKVEVLSNEKEVLEKENIELKEGVSTKENVQKTSKEK